MFEDFEYAESWYPVFEGDGAGAGAGDGDSDAGAGDSEAGSGDGDAGAGIGDESTGDKNQTFTQEQVNKMMAENKRTLRQRNEELIKELEQAKKRTGLSADERQKLTQRIDSLENEMLSKEELSKKEQDKLRKKFEQERSELENDRNSWKNRFTEATIVRSITDEAVKSSAFQPSQIVAILRPNTRLVEAVDAEGQPTGELVPKVKFNTVDKDGKPLQLDIGVGEAVKQMKDMEEYLNLFKGEGTFGLGAGTNNTGKRTDLKDVAKDPAKYRKLRKEGKI